MSGNYDGLSDDQVDEAADHVSRHRRGHSDEVEFDEQPEPVVSSDEIFRRKGPP